MLLPPLLDTIYKKPEGFKMGAKKTCSYAVKNIGKETDGSCNAPAVKKYSEEIPLCRLHYYMRRCELLEEEIEELLNEELVCDYCDPLPEEDEDDSKKKF